MIFLEMTQLWPVITNQLFLNNCENFEIRLLKKKKTLSTSSSKRLTQKQRNLTTNLKILDFFWLDLSYHIEKNSYFV